MNSISDLIANFLPLSCLVCRRPLQFGVVCTGCTPNEIREANCCIKCAKSLSPFEFGFNTCRLCIALPPLFNQMRFIWHYDEKTSALIKTMKYERYISLAKWCASKIVSGLSRFSPTDWDFVLPIPLDTKSVRQRGFDQCAILGSAVAKKLSITCENNICCRKKLVTPQATLSTAERLQNVRNLFKVERDISNKNILLVDDVVTTGATISSLALELRKAGAQSIDVLSLARSDGWHTFRYRVAKAFPFEAAVAQAST